MLQINKLKQYFDKLQLKYGSNTHDAIYGAGEIKNPNICLVFMNPTARNVTANKNWKSIKAPWIGTKNIWRMLYKLNLFNDKELILDIEKKTPK